MPGQEMEITAGVGAFSKAATTNYHYWWSNCIRLGQMEQLTTKLTLAAVLDHTTVPVRITYTDQEGKQQTIDKTVEYTVGSG